MPVSPFVRSYVRARQPLDLLIQIFRCFSFVSKYALAAGINTGFFIDPGSQVRFPPSSFFFFLFPESFFCELFCKTRDARTSAL